MSVIAICNETGQSIIGARAEFRRSDYYFARTQSTEMRELPWERRIKPIRAWNKVAAFAVVAATIGVLAVNVV